MELKEMQEMLVEMDNRMKCLFNTLTRLNDLKNDLLFDRIIEGKACKEFSEEINKEIAFYRNRMREILLDRLVEEALGVAKQGSNDPADPSDGDK